MNNYTVELTKHDDGEHSLVMWCKNGNKEFVVCSYYDETKPVGSQWSWGHYFENLKDATEYLATV